MRLCQDEAPDRLAVPYKGEIRGPWRLRALHRISACVLFLASTVALLRAQSINAGLTGRVTDPSEALVAGARIAAIGSATNLHYETLTNAAGEYYLTNLPPSTYRIEIEKPGFKKLIKPDVILHVQDALEIDFEMTLGASSETINVEAGAPPGEYRVGNGQHGGGPHVRRESSPQWQELPDVTSADARRRSDRHGVRRPRAV
jgi:hypothetical protein